jgi:cyanophycinase
MSGTIALVGGGEWREGCSFDALLAERAGGEVLVLPTAAAYERPELAVAWAQRWFAGLGVQARGLMVLSRADAEDEANAEVIRAARFVYLGGGSPLHLRSVLKESACWEALRQAWAGGAVLAGSSAGAMVLTDPMVDPRGGAFTLGLGLVENLAVIPHFPGWSDHRVARTVQLAAEGLVLVGIEERTALIREPDGGWGVAGAGKVEVMVDGGVVGLDCLPH